MVRIGKDTEVVEFSEIRLQVPQKWLRKLFYADRHLTHEETLKISGKLREIEQAQNRILHLLSIVDKIRLKSLNKETGC